MLRLRPHHILDIVRNIGHEREIKPHEYGHLVHIVTRELLDNINQECQLIVENDDICGPCIHLSRNGECTDVLSQLSDRVMKQVYNDALDTRILEHLQIKSNAIMKVSDYLRIVKCNIETLAPICTHPKEDVEYRRTGLQDGLRRLRIK